jgi:hypothetical protein
VSETVIEPPAIVDPDGTAYSHIGPVERPTVTRELFAAIR